MRLWILAAVIAAACASAPPSSQGEATEARQTAPTAAYAADARSTATDEEVRDARRAYRAACQRSHSDGYCECMTGGMAQALPPVELGVATAAFTGQEVQASPEVRARVEATRAQVDAGCAQFRRS
jgi:hypothetical protein